MSGQNPAQEERKRSFGASLADLLKARAQKHESDIKLRDRLQVLDQYRILYFLWGGQVFEALNSLGDNMVLQPADLGQVISLDTIGLSVPGQFVYMIDLVGDPKVVLVKLRRELARIRGISLQDLLAAIEVKIVGRNILIVRK